MKKLLILTALSTLMFSTSSFAYLHYESWVGGCYGVGQTQAEAYQDMCKKCPAAAKFKACRQSALGNAFVKNSSSDLDDSDKLLSQEPSDEKLPAVKLPDAKYDVIKLDIQPEESEEFDAQE